MKRDELRRLNRDELFARAEALGVPRPAVLTQSELVDEIVKRVAPSASGVRGWLGRARDLVAQVVSKGLHLPEAARLFRSELPEPLPPPPPPLPTVTLAEIYVAQGHVAKGVAVIEQVLEREPSHAAAQELAEAWRKRLGRSAPPSAAASAEPEPTVAELTAEPTAEPIAEPSEVAVAQPIAPSIEEVRRPTIERDRLELAALPGERLSIAWELRPVRYARALADAPGGEFVVRMFTARAEANAVATSTTDVPVDGVRGAITLAGFAGRAEVCACLARRAGATFVPLAVASRVTLPA
ncbi:MAG: hypothetical protein FJ095_17225 [Deltaproteobacteria bacterium]|nr:hypothetical protein [Deltaproteobacteria bacterium]